MNHMQSAVERLRLSPRKVIANWDKFLLVNVFSIATACAVLVKGNGDNSNPTNLASNFSTLGVGSGNQLGSTLELGVVLTILVVFISIFLHALQISLELASADNRRPTLDQLLDSAKMYVVPLFLLSILSAISVFIGLLLIIVPGIIIFSRIAFAPYIMVDQNLGIIDSLKASNELSKAHQKTVWSTLAVYLFIIIASLGFLMIGDTIRPGVGNLLATFYVVLASLLLPLTYLHVKKSKTKAL